MALDRRAHVGDLDLDVGGLIGLDEDPAERGGLRPERAGGAFHDLHLGCGHRRGVGGLQGRDAVLGRLQSGRVVPVDLFDTAVVADQQDAADDRGSGQRHQRRADAGQPSAAQPWRTAIDTVSDLVALVGYLGSRTVLVLVACLLLFGYRYRIVWRVLSIGGVQLAGASISFHPSSPGLFELLTEYFTPSGPTTSPLDGL